MRQSHYRNSPINIRALEPQKRLIDKAAAYKGVSRTEFMLKSTCQAAKNVLLDRRLFIVNDETYDSFTKLIEESVDNKQT